MKDCRPEFRIFGLLIFALIATYTLGAGIKESNFGSESFLGLEFYISGPSAAFFILLYFFHHFGLYKLGLHSDVTQSFNRPTESLTIDEIDQMLVEIDVHNLRAERYKTKLNGARDALNNNVSSEEALIAFGINPVRRPIEKD